MMSRKAMKKMKRKQLRKEIADEIGHYTDSMWPVNMRSTKAMDNGIYPPDPYPEREGEQIFPFISEQDFVDLVQHAALIILLTGSWLL